MGLSRKEKKYLRRHWRKKNLSELSEDLNLDSKEIEKYLEKSLGKEKLRKKESFLLKEPALEKEKIFSFKNWWHQNHWLLLLLLVLAFLTYANSLNNEFLSDDISGILENRNLGKIEYVFSQPLSSLRHFLYFLTVNLFGKVPIFFRLINIFFHLGTVALVFLLLSFFCQQKMVAFLTAALVAVHPLMTEAVVWISGGTHIQYSFFLLLSFLFYLFKRKDKKYYFYSLLAFILALLSSEKAIVLPFIIFLYIFTFENLKKEVKKTIPYFVLSFGYGLTLLGSLSQRVVDLQTKFYQNEKTIPLYYKIPISIISYLKLAIFPKDLTLYHTELSFTQEQFFFIFFLFIIFMFLIGLSFFKKQKLIFFWLCFFIISLLPTLTPLNIAWLVAERYVYLGAIGLFATLALLLSQVDKKINKNQLLTTLFLSLVLPLLIARTVIRNIDWKNQDNLWLAAGKTSPSSHQNHNNLGDYYARHNDLEEAIGEFKKAIELKPGYAEAYHNLANVYWRQGKIDLAIENYQKALEFNPGIWQSYQNLAALYFEKGDPNRARREIEKGLEIAPQNSSLYLNLGIIYFKQGENEEAKKAVYKSLELEPENEKAKEFLNFIENPPEKNNPQTITP